MAKHLIIDGLVQGVGYRASFAAAASAAGVAGWVRNRSDGSVEACIHGDPLTIDAPIAWARRGPAAARVSDVLVTESGEATPIDGQFAIRPTV